MLEGVISLRGWETSNKVDSGPLELCQGGRSGKKNDPTEAPEHPGHEQTVVGSSGSRNNVHCRFFFAS